MSILLPAHLLALGLEPLEVGALLTATLLGSAALTLAVGLLGRNLPPHKVLLAACGLMLATAVGFQTFASFWPLLLVAFVGTLNPSAGDVSVFLPTEQSLLSEHDRAAGCSSRGGQRHQRPEKPCHGAGAVPRRRALLGMSSFGWPLVVGGGLKILYDLLLFAGFRGREPVEDATEPMRP
jgi:hypothetical protein